MITNESLERVRGWFTGRLPADWSAGSEGPAEVTVDREEITVLLAVPDVEAHSVDSLDVLLRAAEQADLLLAVGTSLQVYPVAGAVPVAKAAGARVVIVNAEPTPPARA